MNFAEIIRSSKPVRNALDQSSLHQWWWRSILALHGKPRCDTLPVAERKRILSAGFRFYAFLYAGLALAMFLTFAELLYSDLTETLYWPGLALFASLYLGASSSLAFKGARQYPTDTTAASGLLVVFFVAVIGFLLLFAGAASVVVHQLYPSSDTVSVPFLAAVVVFGVGSYLIEILYLFYSCTTARD